MRLLKLLFERMRFPQLFLVLLGLWLFDMITPDPIPFIDEAILALLTVMVGLLQRPAAERRSGGARGEGMEKEPEKNITPGS